MRLTLNTGHCQMNITLNRSSREKGVLMEHHLLNREGYVMIHDARESAIPRWRARDDLVCK